MLYFQHIIFATEETNDTPADLSESPDNEAIGGLLDEHTISYAI